VEAGPGAPGGPSPEARPERGPSARGGPSPTRPPHDPVRLAADRGVRTRRPVSPKAMIDAGRLQPPWGGAGRFPPARTGAGRLRPAGKVECPAGPLRRAERGAGRFPPARTGAGRLRPAGKVECPAGPLRRAERGAGLRPAGRGAVPLRSAGTGGSFAGRRSSAGSRRQDGVALDGLRHHRRTEFDRYSSEIVRCHSGSVPRPLHPAACAVLAAELRVDQNAREDRLPTGPVDDPEEGVVPRHRRRISDPLPLTTGAPASSYGPRLALILDSAAVCRSERSPDARPGRLGRRTTVDLTHGRGVARPGYQPLVVRGELPVAQARLTIPLSICSTACHSCRPGRS
jgi:hypothetical protein